MKNLIIIAVFVLALTGCTQKVAYVTADEIKQYDVITTESSFVIDVDNPSEASGFSDYVFVGKIENFVNYEYEYIDDGTGGTIELPISVYTVRVQQNLKNELSLEKEYELRVHGGLSSDFESFVEPEGFFPFQVGKNYILYTSVNESGDLYKTEGVDAVRTDFKGNSKKIDKNINLTQEAVKYEIPFERTRKELE